MTGRFAGALRRLLRVEGSPHRIALAFAIGAFIAFSPLPPVFGMHTLLGLLIAFALRLDRVAMVAGVWVNNFATMPFTYLAGTLLGCALLDRPLQGPEGFEWGGGGLAVALREIRPYLWPFVVGNTILSLACGVLAYVGLRLLLERRRLARAAEPAPTAR